VTRWVLAAFLSRAIVASASEAEDAQVRPTGASRTGLMHSRVQRSPAFNPLATPACVLRPVRVDRNVR
jgi:hypothetical protein